MSFDPRKWDPDMDISVAVGLGTGNRQRLLASYQQILQIQQAFMQQLGKASPVGLSQIVYTCHKMCEAAGLEAPERFFGTEEDARKAEEMFRNQPEQPSKEQTEAQRKAYETQSRLALDRQKVQGQLALKGMEMQLEKELDQTKLLMGENSPALTNIRGVGGM